MKNRVDYFFSWVTQSVTIGALWHLVGEILYRPGPGQGWKNLGTVAPVGLRKVS